MMSAWLSARFDAQLRDLRQRWRRCLASLILFTIILTNNFGVSSSWTDVRSEPRPCSARQPRSLLQCLPDRRRHSPAEQIDVCASQPPLHWLNSCGQNSSSDALSYTSRAHEEYLQECDRIVEKEYAKFVDIMDRLDCTDTYSVIYNCSQCKEAYHDWLCAMYVPFICSADGRLLRPCRSYCLRVQRVCPYFLPSERKPAATQYAGEPAFFCDDPDIPDIPPFTTGCTYGDPDCCYDSCCSRPDQPECRPDSCSAAAHCLSQPPPPTTTTASSALAGRPNQLQRHSPAAKVRRRRRHGRRPGGGGSGAGPPVPSALLVAAALGLLACAGRHRTRTKGSCCSVT